jgi:hypothetical protein
MMTGKLMKKPISIAIVLVLLFMTLPTIALGQVPSEKYAVIVSYDNRGDCHVWASTCARLFRSILLDNGFIQKNITFLHSNKATKANVIEAIGWLDSVEDENTEVVIGFFGHGSATHIMLKGLAISHQEIRDLLLGLESQKQLIVIDTCGSAGAILPGRDGITLNATNRIVLTSTWSENESSIFSWHLTNWCKAVLVWGMQEGNADFNGDGRVSVQEAGSIKGRMSDGYGQEFFL